eukprot:1771801-Alexandrium_andersonii.AAC.1
MSASLVGSEMCIRDRPMPDATTANLRLDETTTLKITEPEQHSGISCAHPVSYTHLTRPTICSV